MLRTTFLLLSIIIIHNSYAAYDYAESEIMEDDEWISVNENLPESIASTKRYGDLKYDASEWLLILCGTILLNIGVWRYNSEEDDTEAERDWQKQNRIKHGRTESVDATKKRKEILNICLIIIGFICLYPCLFGLYYHFMRGAAHILGFGLCLIPYALYLLKKYIYD